MGATGLAQGSEPPPGTHAPVHDDFSRFIPAAEKVLQSARQSATTRTNDVRALWEWGRATFDLAEFQKNDKTREKLAKEGIEACRRAIAVDPKSAEAHYYLALNLGQLARTKALGALRIIPDIERELKAARSLDAALDYGGADRALGLLFRDAPGWPLSVGSREQARKTLLHAIELAPDYPGNQLNLLESYLHWGEKENARKSFKPTHESILKGRTNFAGEVWGPSWAEWDDRWLIASNKVSRLPAPKK